MTYRYDRVCRWLAAASLIVGAIALVRSSWAELSKWVSESGALAGGWTTSIDHAALIGSRTARVVVVELSDFDCPFCREFANKSRSDLQRRYVDDGRVLWAFQPFPLVQLHPGATAAAQLAMCAAKQQRFEAVEELLFHNAKALDGNWLRTVATNAGADPQLVEECLQDSSVTLAIARGVAEARAHGVSGTPTFLIGRPVSSSSVRVDAVISGLPRPGALDTAIVKSLALASPPSGGARQSVGSQHVDR